MRVRGNRATVIILAMLLAVGGIPGLFASGNGKAYAADTVQVWQEIGNAGFSPSYVSSVTMSVYEGTPYVSFRDQNDKATVMRNDGTAWATVGSAGFSAGFANNLTMTMFDGIPYVAYSDGGNDYNTTVMKYTEAGPTGWEAVGSPGFSEGLAHYQSISIYDGTPYVAYKDWQNGGKATVMKYTGAGPTGWESLGSAGFSAGLADNLSLQVDEGTPYVAFTDGDKSDRATVMKYTGAGPTGWESVGSSGFSAGSASNPSLKVYGGTPYVVYRDEGNDSKATVMKYTGAGPTGWESVGRAGFSGGVISTPSLVVYDGTPYVGYTDGLNGQKATVMKYAGSGATGWVPVGIVGFSADMALSTSLVVYEGTPYVAYQDGGNGFKATAMRVNMLNAPPSLTANKTAEGKVEIAFTDDEAWRNAITAVKEGTNTLAAGTDYIVDTGKIMITKEFPQGTYSIAIEANGYANATVIFALSDDFDGGMGTASQPFRIARAEQLDAVRAYLGPNLYFQLTADIDLSGYQEGGGWEPIMSVAIGLKPFQGHIDGNGYKITGLTINRPDSNAVGLFGAVADGSITNMRLENVNISGASYVGGLAGGKLSGTISDSYVTGNVRGSLQNTGGLVGINMDGTISDSYVTGAVTGDQNVGGLAGNNMGTISNSYSAGSVTGKYGVGGLVSNNMGMISNSYATGAVTGIEKIGGLVGVNEGTIRSGFYDTETTGQSDTDKGVGKTTAEMKTQSTYNDSGWEYDEVWGMDPSINNGYPFLRWTTRNVQFDSNGGTIVDSQTVAFKGNATKPGDPTRTGYTFGGWYADSDFIVPFDFSAPITWNLTLYAMWTEIGSSGGSEGVSTTSPPANSTNGKLSLSAGQAGEVSLDDEITISVPAGAAPHNLRITIEKLVNTQNLLTTKEVRASSVFEVQKNFSGKFSKLITLTMLFDSSKLKNNQSVAIFYYDESAKAWVEISGGKINGNRISVQVDHFAKFAVLAVDKATEPTENPTGEDGLTDISGHWAETSIKEAIGEGIVKGYRDGSFKPDANVTRAEFAMMLMNALKFTGSGTKLHFTDSIPSWALLSIGQAVEAGIVSGYEDGSFRPEASLTRSELAVMMARAAGADTLAVSSTGFADDSVIPAWAKGSVAAVKQLGIVNGRSGNRFAPDAAATRAEAITIIMNLLEV
ncbi:S-layer homology domain-containing protein [Paenibacillus sp. GCM10027627]|uniref:S-layer homology domain-containing protein n=1 Tax=unclassified Paenibacillus TaxID=185978 RepID=UPI003628E857